VLPLGAPYQLSIVRPTGGAVKGAGIDCGTKRQSCVVNMPGSMTIGLQATPDWGYTFAGWSSHCAGTSPSYALELAGPRTCGATFVAVEAVPPPDQVVPPSPTGGPLPMGAPYTLTVSRPTGGKIRSAGISCGTRGRACTVTMPAAMWLGLDAAPDRGYTFAGWTGHCSGTSQSFVLELNGPRTCGAIFTPAASGSPQ
jgi:uncharacterized repeat protein (TIGR02543 family)